MALKQLGLNLLCSCLSLPECLNYGHAPPFLDAIIVFVTCKYLVTSSLREYVDEISRSPLSTNKGLNIHIPFIAHTLGSLAILYIKIIFFSGAKRVSLLFSQPKFSTLPHDIGSD